MSDSKGDDIARAFFIGQLRHLFDTSDVEDQLRDRVSAFLDSVDLFLELLLSVRALPEGEEYSDDRVIATVSTLAYSALTRHLTCSLVEVDELHSSYRSRRNIYQICPPTRECKCEVGHFIRKLVLILVQMHLQTQNYVEAALTLKLHSDLHEWNLNTFVGPMEDLGLPQQSLFHRKETLCLLILNYLGMYWPLIYTSSAYPVI